MSLLKTNNEKITAVLSIAIALLALLTALFVFVSESRKRAELVSAVTELKDRVSELESAMEKKEEKVADPAAQGMAVNQLFSFAGVENQMKTMKKEIEELKNVKQGVLDKVIEDKNISIVKDVNKTFHKTWIDSMDRQLQQAGYQDKEKETAIHYYTGMLQGIEDIQIRWVKGELKSENLSQEIKNNSLQFFDSVSRSMGEEKANAIINMAFPNPDMRKVMLP